MTTINQNGRSSAIVQLGGVLTISGDGKGAIVQRDPLGNGEPGTPVAFTGTTLTFGPYDQIATFRIFCDSGSMTYDTTVPYINAVNRYATKRSKSVKANEKTGFNLQAGSNLVISGDGIATIVQRRLSGAVEPLPPIFYLGTTITIDAVPYDRLYKIDCSVGLISFVSNWAGGIITIPPIPTIGAFGELLPAYFARFNNGVIPEALDPASTPAQKAKYFFIEKTPPRVAPVEPNVTLDLYGDPIFASMTTSDNDRTFDDDLDYEIWMKHPTDPARNGAIGTGGSGTPYANFTKMRGGRRTRILGWDTLGNAFTYTSGNGGTFGEQQDYSILGPRGDFAATKDADFVLHNGVNSDGVDAGGKPVRNGPRPNYRLAYAYAKNQHGNNRDPYLRFNDPSSPKMALPVSGNITKDGSTGLVSIAFASAFPDKLLADGSAYTSSANQPVSGDFFSIDGSSFGGDTTELTRFNWKLNIVTVKVNSANGTISNNQSAPAGSPIWTLAGTWLVGDKIDLYLHGTRFAYTVVAGSTSLGAIAAALLALVKADGRFSGSTGTSTAITVVSTAGKQVAFTCELESGHNVPAGAQFAVGGTAYWFILRTPTNTSIGTHADWGQYTQTQYFRLLMADLGVGDGNYDTLVAHNGANADTNSQFTRIDSIFKYVAPSDPSSGSFRLGYTLGAGAFDKYIYQLRSQPRPNDTIASGIALSVNGGDAVLDTSTGVEIAYMPGRPEIKGVVKRKLSTDAPVIDFAMCGTNFVDPGESDVNAFAGVITDLIFMGASTIPESTVTNTALGVFEPVTTNKGGLIDFQIMGSNVSLNHWFLSTRKLRNGFTRFDYETSPIIDGKRVVYLDVGASIRGSNPMTIFVKRFYWEIIDDIAASGLTVVSSVQSPPTGVAVPVSGDNVVNVGIGAASTGRYVLFLTTTLAGSMSRDFPLTVPVTGGTARRLVRKKTPLLTNPTANIAIAAAYIARIDTGTAADITLNIAGSSNAMSAGAVAITGLSSDEPFSIATADNGVSGGQVQLGIDVPANGTAIVGGYYSTPTNGNKYQAAIAFSRPLAGTYQVRGTVTAGTAGPMVWELATAGDGSVGNPYVWTAINATNAAATGFVGFYDMKIEDSGSGGTCVVAASFGPAT
jgi:hypothetical protein